MEQQFSLSWNNFHGNLSNGFAGLLGNGEFVDVTLAVEGHLLQAHKVILSICSPYFKKMFQTNPCQHPIVVLRDVTLRVMQDLLQFMYHGEVSVKREELTSFIGTAQVLQIKGLTNRQTDEDSTAKEQELQKHTPEQQNNTPDVESCNSEPLEGDHVEERLSTDEMNQNQYNVKLQRYNNLKRKSDDFLQKPYYSPDIFNFEKKIKKDKPYTTLLNNSNLQSSNKYDQYRLLRDENPVDPLSSNNPTEPLSFKKPVELNSHKTAIRNNTDDTDKSKTDQMSPNSLNNDVKTECEDDDIIITDPAVCDTPKGFETSREGQKDGLEFQSHQDNCSGLNSLFMDLKNLVNGKVTQDHDISRTNPYEDISRGMLEHRLVTIPQKEDGKKKYPQRSCRLCWKIGKRRDTRFMCNAYALSLVVNGSAVSQQLPVRYKYIYSRKGHKQLVHSNFVYTKHSTSHGKTAWRCVQYFSLNRCPATVETIDAMIFAINHQHNHEDCYEKLTKNQIYYESSEPK